MSEKRRRRIFDEIAEIEEEIDRIFEEALSGHPMWNPQLSCLEPLAQVSESEDKVTVTVDLPFVKKEDVKLDVTPQELNIEAKMQRHVIYNKWGTVQRTCKFRDFTKTIKLPSEVIPELAKAKFRQGFLLIEIPKKTKKHKIEIE